MGVQGETTSRWATCFVYDELNENCFKLINATAVYTGL